MSSDCEISFDVTADGFTENVIPECELPGFIESARNAVLTLRFEPKMVDGKAVPRKNVVYPISYRFSQPEPQSE